MGWTRGKTLKLVEGIRKRPVLWRDKVPTHTHTQLQLESIRSLADEMRLPFTKVLRKYKEICKRYSSEFIKEFRSRTYESNWYLFKELDFMKCYVWMDEYNVEFTVDTGREIKRFHAKDLNVMTSILQAARTDHYRRRQRGRLTRPRFRLRMMLCDPVPLNPRWDRRSVGLVILEPFS